MENPPRVCITAEAVSPGDHFWPPLSPSPLNKKGYIELARNSLGCSSKKQGFPHVHASDKERTCWIIIENSEFSTGGKSFGWRMSWTHLYPLLFSCFRSNLSRYSVILSDLWRSLMPSLRHCNTVNIQTEPGSPTYISFATSQLSSLGWPPNHSYVCLLVSMNRNVSRTAQECFSPWSIWE